MSVKDFKKPGALYLKDDPLQLKRWLTFKQEFEDFLTNPEFKGLSDGSKSDIFLNCIGDEAKQFYIDVFKTEKTHNYEDLIQCFDDHFKELHEMITDDTEIRGKIINPFDPRCCRPPFRSSLSDFLDGNDDDDDDDDKDFLTKTIPELIKDLNSDDLEVRTLSTQSARRFLSSVKTPPIDEFVNAGIIPPLVDALTKEERSDLQYEAAWALTNIASGLSKHTDAVVDGGAIPHLVALLPRGELVGTQAAWALGNIAANGPVNRDAVLNSGVLSAILPYMVPNTPTEQLQTYVWLYSNMCRSGGACVKLELVSPALPYIADLLVTKDKNVLSDSCNALDCLTYGRRIENIAAVLAVPSLTSRLIALLSHDASKVKKAALSAVISLLAGTDTQADRCIDAGALDPLIALLSCDDAAIAKSAALAVSNIMAGSHTQIQRALDHHILQPLIKMLEHDDGKCKKQAAEALTSLCLNGTAEQLEAFLSAGSSQPLCIMLSLCAQLSDPEPHTVLLTLDCLSDQLRAAGIKKLTLKIIGIADQIQALQHHNDEQVKIKATKIMDTYF